MTGRGNLCQLNLREKTIFMKKSEKGKQETLKEHLEIAINVLYYFYEQIKNIEDDSGTNISSCSNSGGGNDEPSQQEKTERS